MTSLTAILVVNQWKSARPVRAAKNSQPMIALHTWTFHQRWRPTGVYVWGPEEQGRTKEITTHMKLTDHKWLLGMDTMLGHLKTPIPVNYMDVACQSFWFPDPIPKDILSQVETLQSKYLFPIPLLHDQGLHLSIHGQRRKSVTEPPRALYLDNVEAGFDWPEW